MINTRNDLGRRGLTRGGALAVGVGLALAALALLMGQAWAQDVDVRLELRGTVVDADNGHPLVGAWVSVDDSKWGSVTDDGGRFLIPDVSAGRLSLSVEQLGYETLGWQGEIGPATGPLELALAPQPLLLEGLEVVTDRFRARRNAVATSVFAYGVDQLATSPQRTALDFVEARAGTFTLRCAGRRGDVCLFVRGRVVEPMVYLDEMPVLGGLEYLDTFAPHELYMIEVYGRGRHIRAYTPRFMERAAKQRLSPIALLY